MYLTAVSVIKTYGIFCSVKQPCEINFTLYCSFVKALIGQAGVLIEVSGRFA